MRSPVRNAVLVALWFVGPVWGGDAAHRLSSHEKTALDSAAVAISHVVDGVEQGGTLTIFGENLTETSRVWLWQPSPEAGKVLNSAETMAELRQMAAQFPALPALPPIPPAAARAAQRLGATGHPRVLMVRQAGSPHPAWDDSHIVPTVLWIEQQGIFSQPYLLNQPQLWFASEPWVVPGEQVRLFGNNLLGGQNNPSRSLIALRNEATGEVYWGRQHRRYNQEHANVRQHQLSFRLPDPLPPGNYSLRVHPLAGGPYGWSNPLSLEVIEQRDWLAQMGKADENTRGTPDSARFAKSPRVFRVSAAAGDGLADDGPAIRRALREAAAQGGGVVVLPAGRFALAETLEVPAGIVLQGLGCQATSLTVSPLAPLRHGTTLVLLKTRTGLQDLSVIAGPGVEVNVRVEDQPTVEDVFLRRVRIENTHSYLWNQESARWQNPDFGLLVNASSQGFRLLQSEIVAPMTFRMEGYGRRHRYAQIAGNRFETYPPHQQDNVFLLTLSESIFENNLMVHGHRAFTSQRGLWRNYIAQNQAIDTRGVGNGSEVLMSEYGTVLYDGRVVQVDAAHGSFQLPESISKSQLDKLEAYRKEHELYAFLAAGAGFGQFRQVVQIDAGTLRIDHPWRVAPNASSEILLLGASTHNLLINNAAEGGRGVLTFFYGSAVNNIVTGNEANRGGVTPIWACAVAHDEDSALLAFNTFANNRLVQNGSLNLAALDWAPDRGRPPLNLGNRLIRNQVWRPGDYGSPNQYYAAWNWQRGANAGHGWTEPGPRQGIAIWNGSFNVVENNYVDDAEIGLFAGPGRGAGAAQSPVQGNVFRWNRIDRTDIPVKDQGASTHLETPSYQPY